jgi:hypothetical protein
VKLGMPNTAFRILCVAHSAIGKLIERGLLDEDISDMEYRERRRQVPQMNNENQKSISNPFQEMIRE